MKTPGHVDCNCVNCESGPFFRHQSVKRLTNNGQVEGRCIVDDEPWPCRTVKARP